MGVRAGSGPGHASSWTARSTREDEARWEALSRWMAGEAIGDAELEVARAAARDLAGDEARTRTIVGHCPRAVAVLGEGGRLVGFNRAFRALVGEGAALGATLTELFDEPDRSMLETVLRTAGTPQRAGATVRLPVGGASHEVEFLAATLPSEEDAAGVVLAVEDRTAALDEEGDRAATGASLREADRAAAFGLAAAMVLHDLAGLVTVAWNNCRLLREREPEPAPGASEGGALLEDATSALEQAARLLRGMREFRPAVPESAGAACEVDAVVAGVERLLRPALRRARARLERRVPPGLTAAVGAGELTQVLFNLVDNAAHAVEDGGGIGTVVVSAERAEDDGGAVVIRVRDDGVGIDPAKLASVFDPFESSRKSAGGTGLGLAIVRRTVEGVGGRVQVVSLPSRGTEFVVVVPAAPPSA